LQNCKETHLEVCQIYIFRYADASDWQLSKVRRKSTLAQAASGLGGESVDDSVAASAPGLNKDLQISTRPR